MGRKTIEDLARAQHGAITRAQALAAGVSGSAIARRIAAGEWEAAAAGVYRLERARNPWLQDVSVACLATGGVASHLTAGRLWKLALPSPKRAQPIDVLVDAERRPRSSRAVTVHRTRTRIEAEPVQGVTSCTLASTLLQLAEILDDRWLERALDSALRRERGLREQLAGEIAGPRRGEPAALRLRALI